MPATKRKYSYGKYSTTKRRKLTRPTSISSKPLALSIDHKVLRMQQKAVLRYHEDFQIDPGTGGTPGFYVFRANSLRDPNFSGVGTQPRGYDQLSALYKYARVDEVQIELWSDMPNDSNNRILSITCEGKYDNALNFPTRKKLMETPQASFGASSHFDNNGKLTLRCKPWLIAGLKASDDGYRHDIANDPENAMYLNVRAMSVDPAQNSAVINLVARITFHCTFTDPEMPTAS